MKEKPVEYTKNYKRTIFTWSLYDFANQPFPTLIITFIYSAFFADFLASDFESADSMWLYAVSISSILIALLSPIMGVIADKSGYRKTFLIAWTWICVIGSILLFFPLKGQIIFALSLVVISNIGFEMGSVFCNSYLPHIAPKEKIGRISGYGWSFGYVGGLLSLAVCYFLFVLPDNPVNPISGNLLDTGSGENIRFINLFVALWFFIFSIPTFIYLKDRKRDKWKYVSIKKSYSEIVTTFREIRKYKNIFRFLIARMFYNDAILTIFFFGGIYATQTFKFDFNELMVFGIVLNIAAGLGAFAFGFFDDIVGARKTVQFSNIAIFISIMIAVLAQSPIWFWVSGIILGIFSGPNQSASRSLMGRIVPKEKVNEFFGFYAFSGKATSFIGPLMLAVINQITGSQRMGILAVSLLLIVGMYLLNGVKEDSKNP